MGFGMELMLLVGLGFLILGPKQMHTMLVHIGRAKAQIEKASRSFKSELAEELKVEPREHQ